MVPSFLCFSGIKTTVPACVCHLCLDLLSPSFLLMRGLIQPLLLFLIFVQSFAFMYKRSWLNMGSVVGTAIICVPSGVINFSVHVVTIFEFFLNPNFYVSELQVVRI